MSEIPTACRPYDDDLSALIDGELSSEREAEVRAHLTGCSGCAGRLEELCNVDLELASLPQPQVSARLERGFTERVAAERRQAPATQGREAAAQRGAAERRQAPARQGREAALRGPSSGWRRRVRGASLALAAAAALVLAFWIAVRSDAPSRAPRLAEQTPSAVEAPVVPAPEERSAPFVAQTQPETSARSEVALLAGLEAEDAAMLLELDELEDLDVIANLELLETLVALDLVEGAG